LQNTQTGIGVEALSSWTRYWTSWHESISAWSCREIVLKEVLK